MYNIYESKLSYICVYKFFLNFLKYPKLNTLKKMYNFFLKTCFFYENNFYLGIKTEIK